jgi:hypothetical protein
MSIFKNRETSELTDGALFRMHRLILDRHERIDREVLAESIVLDDVLDADEVDDLPYG